jgi:XTP/dITP diphosphohydrolase
VTGAGALPHEIVVATRNAGKLRELRPLFAELGVEVIDLAAAGIPESAGEDSLEQYETFAENALAKARYFARLIGRPAVADDSGLEVLALGGRPGVRSKRFAEAGGSGLSVDAANNAKLLEQLSRETDRRARFVCAAAYVGDGREMVRLGATSGVILEEPAGSEGFGFDPLFRSDELGFSFGQATREQKARVSHRARAFVALVAALRGGR